MSNPNERYENAGLDRLLDALEYLPRITVLPARLLVNGDSARPVNLAPMKLEHLCILPVPDEEDPERFDGGPV